jgi:MoaA/NifB/PqqE/SkfB family radical SAM enzyme
MERFCTFPFERVEINAAGEVRTCCKAWMETTIGNLFESRFEAVWNSDQARSIRRSIQDNSFRYCNRHNCSRYLSGIVSSGEQLAKGRQCGAGDPENTPRYPRMLVLNYDYTCNLYCRSCRTARKILGRRDRKRVLALQEALLESGILKKAHRLIVTGAGDPFAGAVYHRLFTNLNAADFPDLKLLLRTNGTRLTPRTWERLENIHYAVDEISVSIDAATEATYRHLRRGGDFPLLLANLRYLSTIREQVPFRLVISFVVQQANFHEMKAFVAMGRKLGCSRINFSKVYRTGAMDRDTYRKAAVHDPRHRDHGRLKAMLQDPLFRGKAINMGNLSNLMEKESQGASAVVPG